MSVFAPQTQSSIKMPFRNSEIGIPPSQEEVTAGFHYRQDLFVDPVSSTVHGHYDPYFDMPRESFCGTDEGI